ncbi:hypothetical protein CFT61_10135 [Segatella copri]|uniref:Uncharacterized protein n=1 Tax=Segatella copri TaxID=165179 RepID=A0AA91TIX5_9BACT|nr:hypothetical protein CFT61_10135 [Segatella copri]
MGAHFSPASSKGWYPGSSDQGVGRTGKIVPLVVGGVIGDAAPSFNSLVGRLCLRCGSYRIHRWDMHTCPKCGGKMQPTGEEEFWT